jgi:RHS repeat-associated protein
MGVTTFQKKDYGVLDKHHVTPAYFYTLKFYAAENQAYIGLLYMRNRWYDPSTGRFMTQDPSDIQGGVNLYRYVINNPLNSTDPFGLCGGSQVSTGIAQIAVAGLFTTALILNPPTTALGAALLFADIPAAGLEIGSGVVNITNGLSDNSNSNQPPIDVTQNVIAGTAGQTAANVYQATQVIRDIGTIATNPSSISKIESLIDLGVTGSSYSNSNSSSNSGSSSVTGQNGVASGPVAIY